MEGPIYISYGTSKAENLEIVHDSPCTTIKANGYLTNWEKEAINTLIDEAGLLAGTYTYVGKRMLNEGKEKIVSILDARENRTNDITLIKRSADRILVELNEAGLIRFLELGYEDLKQVIKLEACQLV